MIAIDRLTYLREEILGLAALHGADHVRVFGSIVRSRGRAARDIDFLVQLRPGRSLLDHLALWQDLEELLGCAVDVVDEGGISPHLRQRILAEAVPL